MKLLMRVPKTLRKIVFGLLAITHAYSQGVLGENIVVPPDAPDSTVEKQTEVFRSHRIIGGLKIKIDKNFTLSTFGAVYLGDGPQYRDPKVTNMYAYNGYDIVPGFMMDFGEQLLKIKVASGADFYIAMRILQKGSEEVYEYRPRWNLVLSRPVSKFGTLTWTSRFERIIWNQYVINTIYKRDIKGEFIFVDGKRVAIGKEPSLIQLVSRYQYRSALKYSIPAFTPFKISPFISSESFNYYYPETYFSETEFGVNLSPFNGLALTLSDALQMKFRSGYIIHNHLICLNMFYTLDLSGLGIFKN